MPRHRPKHKELPVASSAPPTGSYPVLYLSQANILHIIGEIIDALESIARPDSFNQEDAEACIGLMQMLRMLISPEALPDSIRQYFAPEYEALDASIHKMDAPFLNAWMGIRRYLIEPDCCIDNLRRGMSQIKEKIQALGAVVTPEAGSLRRRWIDQASTEEWFVSRISVHATILQQYLAFLSEPALFSSERLKFCFRVIARINILGELCTWRAIPTYRHFLDENKDTVEQVAEQIHSLDFMVGCRNFLTHAIGASETEIPCCTSLSGLVECFLQGGAVQKLNETSSLLTQADTYLRYWEKGKGVRIAPEVPEVMAVPAKGGLVEDSPINWHVLIQKLVSRLETYRYYILTIEAERRSIGETDPEILKDTDLPLREMLALDDPQNPLDLNFILDKKKIFYICQKFPEREIVIADLNLPNGFHSFLNFELMLEEKVLTAIFMQCKPQQVFGTLAKLFPFDESNEKVINFFLNIFYVQKIDNAASACTIEEMLEPVICWSASQKLYEKHCVAVVIYLLRLLSISLSNVEELAYLYRHYSEEFKCDVPLAPILSLFPREDVIIKKLLALLPEQRAEKINYLVQAMVFFLQKIAEKNERLLNRVLLSPHYVSSKILIWEQLVCTPNVAFLEALARMPMLPWNSPACLDAPDGNYKIPASLLLFRGAPYLYGSLLPLLTHGHLDVNADCYVYLGKNVARRDPIFHAVTEKFFSTDSYCPASYLRIALPQIADINAVDSKNRSLAFKLISAYERESVPQNRCNLEQKFFWLCTHPQFSMEILSPIRATLVIRLLLKNANIPKLFLGFVLATLLNRGVNGLRELPEVTKRSAEVTVQNFDKLKKDFPECEFPALNKKSAVHRKFKADFLAHLGRPQNPEISLIWDTVIAWAAVQAASLQTCDPVYLWGEDEIQKIEKFLDWALNAYDPKKSNEEKSNCLKGILNIGLRYRTQCLERQDARVPKRVECESGAPFIAPAEPRVVIDGAASASVEEEASGLSVPEVSLAAPAGIAPHAVVFSPAASENPGYDVVARPVSR